jgi:sec-independent protein translocase protein TatA
MGGLSLWHWLIVIIVVMLLFGRGKMSDMMGDFAKGIKSFKKGLAEDDVTPTPAPPSQIAAQQPVPPVQTAPVDAPRT